MSDNKNNGGTGIDRDQKRSSVESIANDNAPILEEGRPEDSFGGVLVGVKKSNKARKKLPVVVDIIIALLMIAMIGGITVGAYALFRYYTNDYDVAEIEYTFVTAYGLENEAYNSMLNKEIYCDKDGSTLYFGKVTSVDISLNQKIVIVTVKADVKYKTEEGYSVGDCKIAVGGNYTLRSQNVNVDCTIVEIVDKNTGK